MRAAEFEASLTEAKQYPEIWRLVLGVGLVLLLWAGTSALIIAGGIAVVSAQQGPFGVMPWLTSLANPATPGTVILLLGTFAGLFIGVMVAAAALHFRGPESLFGPWAEWRRGFLIALGVMAPIYVVLLGLAILLEQPVPGLPLGRWLMFLPLTLALILLQTGAEELFFRGYLQQQLAARFRSRAIWMWGPAIVFAALHYNPAAGANLPLVLLSALAFGLIAADLTERSGSLGAAMGFHLGHNFVGIAIIAISDTVTGLALYTSPLDISRTGPQSLSMALSVVVMFAVWAIIARLLDR